MCSTQPTRLPLAHFVDHVDRVGSPFAFLFGRVHGVDAQVSRTSARLRLAAFADRHRRGSGLVEVQTVPAVDGSFAQVVEVSHRQLGEPLELLAAVDLKLAFENTASSWTREPLMNAVDMREENDVGAAVLGGETAPLIRCRSDAAFAQNCPIRRVNWARLKPVSLLRKRRNSPLTERFWSA